MEKRMCKSCGIEKLADKFGSKIYNGKRSYQSVCYACVRKIYILKTAKNPVPRNLPFFDKDKNEWFKICPCCKKTLSVESFVKSKGRPTSKCKECAKKRSKEIYDNYSLEQKIAKQNKNYTPKVVLRRRELYSKLTDAEKKYRNQKYKDIIVKGNMARRARISKSPVNIPFSKREVITRDGLDCYLCRKTLTENEATIDHVTPLSRGGFHCLSNAKIACRSCNSSKKDKTYDEFIKWRDSLLS